MGSMKKNTGLQKREITVADLSVGEVLLLSTGPCRGWGEILTGLDVCLDVFSDFGDEILADHIRRSPCCRPWIWWQVELVANPRRLVCDEEDEPPTSTEPPTGQPWHTSGGYESSFAYLRRRGLLGVDELASIRARHDGQRILDCHRIELERIAPKYRPNAEMPGYELADLLSLFPEIELTADELRRAEPFTL